MYNLEYPQCKYISLIFITILLFFYAINSFAAAESKMGGKIKKALLSFLYNKKVHLIVKTNPDVLKKTTTRKYCFYKEEYLVAMFWSVHLL